MTFARIMAIAAVSPLIALTMIILVSCLQFSPTYVGRYVFWGLSDVKDYEKFPYLDVRNAAPAFQFRRHLQPETIQSIFEAAEYTHKGKTRRIRDLEHFLKRTGTTALIVIVDDTILYEGYFNHYARDSINTSFSVAKSFTSALIGIAIDEGHIATVGEPITTYLPELRDRGLDTVTIKHLLTMSSGIRYRETELFGFLEFPWDSDPLTYYFPNLRELALTVEADGDPGKHFYYNNYNALLLGMILERSTGRSVAAYLEDKIWKPLGMEYPAYWSIDSEESGFAKMESGINARAIDFAKMGRLFLSEGRWNGTQIISKRWVVESTRWDPTTPKDYYSLPGWWSSFFESGKGYYGYMWWGYSRDEQRYDFYANGWLGQFIYVCPAKRAIIVRNGKKSGAIDSWPELFYRVADRM